MTESENRIPRPTPFDQLPPPELPPERRPPPPSCLRATVVMASGQEELAIVFKRTYSFEPGQPAKPAEEQPPLVTDFVPYDDGEGDGFVSFKEMPEVIGYKSGTDLVIRGSARATRPVTQTQVGVDIDRRTIHRADVFGPRFCDYAGGKLVFTPPRPFDDIPLRYENAYGGRDLRCEAEFVEQLDETVPADDMRRIRAPAADIFSDGNPIMYPRNRFGKGYVLEDHRRELVEGRELPNLEWPQDRLTPENLVVGNPLNWNKQPLPIGFDYLEPAAFPRCSMAGLPPATIEHPGPIQEVERGYVPADFSRGNIFTCAREDLPNLIHPEIGRCASLGLWLPFFNGRESIVLSGMDPSHPKLEVKLPGERAEFRVRGLGRKPVELVGELYLVHINNSDRLLTLVWTARTESPGMLQAPQLLQIENDLDMNLRKE